MFDTITAPVLDSVTLPTWPSTHLLVLSWNAVVSVRLLPRLLNRRSTTARARKSKLSACQVKLAPCCVVTR